MSFISRDTDFYDIPASTYLGLARDRLSIPHITCSTINGQDMTVGTPVTTGGVQALSNKSLYDVSTYIINDVDPTRRIQFDASAVTAGSDIIVQASGNGTITLPDPGGAGLTLLGIGPVPMIGGDWTFTNATPSVSTVTGTIVNAGGMGVAGDIYIGASTNSAGVLRVTDATASVSTATGCAIFAGGMGVAGDIYIGASTNSAGVLRVTDTTASVSTATGCAIFAGGMGVAGDIYIGASTNSAGVLHVTDVTASVSTATGCAIFAGGIGVTQNVNVGGDITASLGTISGSHMQCASAPSVGSDVVRLTDLNAITGTTFLDTFWVQSSSPYPANRLYIVFRRIYNIIFATLYLSTVSFAIDVGDPSTLTPNGLIPVGYRPRAQNVVHIFTTFNGTSEFMILTINTDGSMGLGRSGVFTSGLLFQLTTDNTVSWILP